MAIQNRKTAILFPIILAFTLVGGIYLGMKLSVSGINNRLLIYPRVDKVNTVLNLIEDSYVDTVSRERLEETAIDAVLKTLDPHSVYIPAKEVAAMNEPLEGNFSGIGIQFNTYNDTIVVVSVIDGGPSQKAGLKAGDRLVKIEGKTVAGVKMQSDSIVKRLKGKRGTNVSIEVKRPTQKKYLAFSITRDLVPILSVDAAYMIDDQTGYVKVNKFAKTTHTEFVLAVKKLHQQKMKRLVLDLRGNTGGLLESAISIADEFLPEKKLIVYTQGRSRARTEAFSKAGGECLNDSLILLIDEYSASASEILAGAIQDNDRGWIVGRRSFGKGLVQEQSSLPGGAAIRLTISRYYTPSGRCIQKSYKNGKEKYYEDLHNRMIHGELEQADSIKFNDSLKFVTPKGRVVYGGGGIMPDLFVPADTSGYSPLYYKIHNKGVMNKFAFMYSDSRRNLLSKYKSANDLLKYLKGDHLLERLLDFARNQGVETPLAEINISQRFIQTELEGLIIRNFFDDNAYFKFINADDKTVKESLKLGLLSKLRARKS